MLMKMRLFTIKQKYEKSKLKQIHILHEETYIYFYCSISTLSQFDKTIYPLNLLIVNKLKVIADNSKQKSVNEGTLLYFLSFKMK